MWVKLQTLILLGLFSLIANAQQPLLMQAKSYHESVDVQQFWISEKLDGVRARWNGQQLISRTGKVFLTPKWFIKDFPKMALDGELWLGRGKYQPLMSIVSRAKPHQDWQQVQFRVFDLPEHGGEFQQRILAMQQLPKTTYLKMIPQFQLNTNAELMAKLEDIIGLSGEGLMLHRKTALYQYGRSNDLLKLKKFEDAEAVVIAYKAGKGKFTGMMGAIKVRNDEGKEFYIGSGFNIDERQNPPPLGGRITYRYQGFTQSGIPRFAVFKRLRNNY